MSENVAFWKLCNSRTTYNCELMWFGKFFFWKIRKCERGSKYKASVMVFDAFTLLTSLNPLISNLSQFLSHFNTDKKFSHQHQKLPLNCKFSSLILYILFINFKLKVSMLGKKTVQKSSPKCFISFVPTFLRIKYTKF